MMTAPESAPSNASRRLISTKPFNPLATTPAPVASVAAAAADVDVPRFQSESAADHVPTLFAAATVTIYL